MSTHGNPPNKSQQGTHSANIVHGAGGSVKHKGPKDIGYGSRDMATATAKKGKK